MTVTSQRGMRIGQRMLADIIYHRQVEQSSFSLVIKMTWLLGMLILLPVRMDLMDFWIMMGLPIIWLFFILERHPIGLPYIVSMWLIFVASLVSSFAAPSLSNGLIAILKEVYLYSWFVTVAAILSRLSAKNFRRFLIVWSGMVILHGALIIGQFLSPELWKLSTRIAGGGEVFKNYRAAGLFIDPDKAGSANKAALFQLLGFVPLVFASSSKKVATSFGVLLFASILATGSMGAISAFIVGLISAVIAFLTLSGQALFFIKKFFVQLVIATTLLGGAYYAISQNEAYQERIESIVSGRTDRSTGERFEIWTRAVEILIEDKNSWLGIGPENFRVVDKLGKQLHNDFLAFLVERGLLGVLGLVAFAVTALMKSINLLKMYRKSPPGQSSFGVVVFLAGIVATLFESLTHQVFHTHQFWLVLALQEAVLFRTVTRPTNLILPLRR
jgi:O-antigen ligase